MKYYNNPTKEVLRTFFNFYNRKDIIDYLRKNPDLIKLTRQLGKLAETSNIKGIFLDMHSENIMQRKDGTIVITDPYATFGWD